MALINCPECGKQVSDKAKICVCCGYPLEAYAENVLTSQPEIIKPNELTITDPVEGLEDLAQQNDAVQHAINMKEIWVECDDKVSSVRRLRELHGIDLLTAERMTEDFMKRNGIVEKISDSNAQKPNKKVSLLGIFFIILAIVFLLAKVWLAALFWGFIGCVFLVKPPADFTKTVQTRDYIKHCCPRCGGTNFHAYVQDQVLIPEKAKYTTSLNLNPLKPFTVFNHQKKIKQKEWKIQVSKFVCDDCGNIFQ